MRFQRILKKFSRFSQILSFYRSRNVYLIADKENWILDWNMRALAGELEKQYGLTVFQNTAFQEVRYQFLHFINRYTYLTRNTFRKLHASNHCFVNWYHGDPHSEDPGSQWAFQALLEAVPFTERVVTSCDITKQSLLGLGIKEEKLAVIPIGVDLSQFVPPSSGEREAIRNKLGIPENAFCIGSFQKDGEGQGEGNAPKIRKGPDIFLEVINALSRQYKHLVVLLTGPSRGYVKQGLEKIGVPYLHHHLSDYFDIVPYYHALDLYLITARVEGGPAALMESWGTGVPVVSTRVGMPADLIVPGRNGMLVDIEDVDGLVESSSELIEIQALREQYRQYGLEDVKSCDWPVVAKQYYQKLYRPLLK